MIFVIRVSRWFRFRMWFATSLMQLATACLPDKLTVNPQQVQPEPEPVALTNEQIRHLNAEMMDHTLQ